MEFSINWDNFSYQLKLSLVLMKLLISHSLLSLANSYVIDSPQPSNLNYAWNFGSLLALCLGIQIVTGVTLAMN